MKWLLFIIFTITPISCFSWEFVYENGSKRHLFEMSNIVLASGFITDESVGENFFRYMKVDENKYIRVAKVYSGDISGITAYQLDALADSILFGGSGDRDWVLIFFNVIDGKMIISGCNMYPIEFYSPSVLNGGHASIIKYTVQDKSFKNLCTEIKFDVDSSIDN